MNALSSALSTSLFFGVLVTLAAYQLGLAVNRKFPSPLTNPLVIAIVSVMLLLLGLKVPYKVYNSGAQMVTCLLTPTTVCLAIPLYEQIDVLRHNWKAVLAGILAGVVASLCSILFGSVIFGISHSTYVTLLPKSITTAMGVAVSAELGGYPALTTMSILITGILGYIVSERLCKLFRITDPVAAGVAIGTSAHAFGTLKAMQIGKVQGAMSSLSIAVAGLLTVGGAAVFARFW